MSVNPQTMQDAVLERMGRAHRADDILRAYALARESGIGCINMDLIAGLPGDSAEGFRASLEQVLDLGPENVTVHTLALKKGSRLMEEGGGLPSGAAVADMLDFAWAALRGAGQRPYYLYRQKYMSGSFENVGWCRPGAESLYNCLLYTSTSAPTLPSTRISACSRMAQVLMTIRSASASLWVNWYPISLR